MGFSFFLFPGASFSLRNKYKSHHVFFGIFLLILSIATCLLGIKELLLFSIKYMAKTAGLYSSPHLATGFHMGFSMRHFLGSGRKQPL